MAKMMSLVLGLLLATAAADPVQPNLRSSPVNKTAAPLAPKVVNQAVIKGSDDDKTPDVVSDDDDTETPKVEETTAPQNTTAPNGFLPSQSIKAVPADPTLKDMEAAMASLMLGNSAFGATPMGGSVKQIKNLITKTMIPKVMAAHKTDVALIRRLYNAFAKCRGTMTRSRRGANVQVGAYYRSSRSHKSCRADEAVKFTTQKNCLTQQRNLFLIKKGKCGTFNTLVGKIGTTKDNRAIVTKAGGESVESYITRISVTICGKHTHGHRGNRKDTGGWGGGLKNGFLDKYWRAKDACDRAERVWKNKVKECKVKVAAYKRRKGQCDQFQTSMDASSCKGAIMTNDACQTYSECYNNALRAYNAASKQVRKEVVDRKAEWRGLHRMSCLIDAFSDGKVTGGEVDACKKKAVSTKPMDIKILPPPPRTKCRVTQLYPATGAYKRREFAPLPMLAKGKESVECSGMTEISLKPRKGSPRSCKCTRVTLNGAYSAKAMVKCTNCLDIRRTYDKSSCPIGTKLFAPASKSDWDTFFASTGRLAGPHWIVDVTKPTSRGRRSNDPMNSGNRKQRANGWRTSDGSPWWLRSTGYSEPNGDYHANCYLGLSGSRSNGLTFNDANCGYHSKHYYCQLKKINLKPGYPSPRSCKCQSVDLTGSYKPGKLVKCSECRDVSKSTQRNSCPKGMKIFSPTSAGDWATFIKSASPLNAPHFIIDVTRAGDGCQRGSGGCEKSAMNSRNPRQSTWRTSDRSPWWLRSQPYNQPDGNYKANCYLHLWRTPHNSPSNIQFDDGNRGAGCLYHSRSYYCQPKQKSMNQIRLEQLRRQAQIRAQRQRDAAAKKRKAAKACRVLTCKHNNFKGGCHTFPIGRYDMKAMQRRGQRNDDMSSLKVIGRGCTVTIYEHSRFNGLRQRFGAGSFRSMGGRWNDKMSSLVVSRQPKQCRVFTYKHSNFRGKRSYFSIGRYDMGLMKRRGQRNDDMSSLKVQGRGCTVTIYEHSRFRGKARRFGAGSYRFVGRPWNDKMSSLVVSR